MIGCAINVELVGTVSNEMKCLVLVDSSRASTVCIPSLTINYKPILTDNNIAVQEKNHQLYCKRLPSVDGSRDNSTVVIQ